MTPSGRKVLVYFTAFVVVPAAGLFALEGTTRLFGPDDLFRQTYDPMLLDNRDGRFPYVNRAGYRGNLRGNEVSINSQHLLGPELSEDGRPRLLLLGDSVFFAPGIAFEGTPGPVLERLLGGEFAVLNASSIGWSSDHELAYLREFGPDLNPAMVVLGYCMNDPMSPHAQNLVSVATASSKKWGGFLITLNLILRKHSLFYVWLKGALGVEKRQNGYNSLVEPLFGDESWERNRQVLLDISAWCEGREIPFVVVVFPHGEQLELGEPALLPQRRLAELGAEAGFRVVDLMPVLASGDFLYGDPLHLDRNGMEKAMELVAESVTAEQRSARTQSP